ncbi:hypothetical protein VCSRO141_0836 [Vibrio cholerae]|nr:hypothetical protein DN33_902 [Vibrio cholerae]GIB65410.1 hypothetical protein VCSRO141_0836 [Vibrio cholerae]
MSKLKINIAIAKKNNIIRQKVKCKNTLCLNLMLNVFDPDIDNNVILSVLFILNIIKY